MRCVLRFFAPRRADEYVHQQAFDRAVAALVHRSPVPAAVAEWFTKETTVAPPKRTWKTIAFNPAVLAIVIALLVIGTIFGIRVMERMNDFPGADTARKLLTSCSFDTFSHARPDQNRCWRAGGFIFHEAPSQPLRRSAGIRRA